MSLIVARDPFYTDYAWLYDAHQRGVRGDIEFYRGLALEARGLVIELGVGTGRVAIPTALAGGRVLGLDLSREMLAICRVKAIEALRPRSRQALRPGSGQALRPGSGQALRPGSGQALRPGSGQALRARSGQVGASLELAQADMRAFELGRPAALVTIPHRAFLHNLTEADQRATLEACRRALAPGGRLALNVFNPEIIALVEMMRGAEASEGVPSFDLADQIVETPMPMRAPDGSTHRALLRVHYIYQPQLAALLEAAGFEVQAWYGDFAGAAFGPASTEIVVVARAV